MVFIIQGERDEERELVEDALQVSHLTTSFHLCLVFSKTKDPALKTSGQMYTHSHPSISQV